MARSLKECLKRQVFAVEEGLRLGRPQDILIDPEEHRVAALILTMKGPLQAATVIGGEEVRSFAEDTLPIAGLSALQLAYQAPHVQIVLERGLQFRGRDVITSAGHNVGRILSVLVDDSGRVVEYRVAKGLFRHLLRLTRPVLPEQIQTSGEQVAVIQTEEEQTDGVSQPSASGDGQASPDRPPTAPSV